MFYLVEELGDSLDLLKEVLGVSSYVALSHYVDLPSNT